VLTGHGIGAREAHEVLDVGRRFFALPPDERDAIAIPDFFRSSCTMERPASKCSTASGLWA
jgi:isopenicillin N synthase-like dioxygenase